MIAPIVSAVRLASFTNAVPYVTALGSDGSHNARTRRALQLVSRAVQDTICRRNVPSCGTGRTLWWECCQSDVRPGPQ